MPAPARSVALPPPVAAPVSEEMRLAYVLQHFRQAYDHVPAVAIGYADESLAVRVAAGAADFFQQHAPFPAPPTFREWNGRQVPFFFDTTSETPLLELRAGQAIIGVDVISAAFYLLSGWQEYFADDRDQHGRFPYAASVQKRYGFVALPVVNYYFDILKTAVEHVSGLALKPRSWGAGAPFAAFVTHDVDNLRSGWKAPAKAALQGGQLLKFGRALWRRFTRPDAWDNMAAVAAATAAQGANSTFFILPEHRAGADGTPNADYKLNGKLLKRLRALASSASCELALHGSIGTAEDAPRLARERQRLPEPVPGLRFHYLRWEPRLTPWVVAGAGLAYDSTLGFAEHFGFRHSYCHPFYPFNFRDGGAHALLEIPLNVMDATLHHPRYLQLRPEEIVPALQPMLHEIARFGGVATILWHNENFDPANTRNGPREFAALVQELRRGNATFLTGRALVAALHA